MLKRSFSLGLFLFVLTATTFIAEREEDLIERSMRICTVEVLSERVSGSGHATSTLYKLKPLECYKDSATKNFEVSVPGGMASAKTAAGKIVQMKRFIPSAPRFLKGQTYLLYLNREKTDSPWLLLSWTQGVNRLRKDPKTSEWIFEEPKIINGDGSSLKNSSLTKSNLSSAPIHSLKEYKTFISEVLKSNAKH